MKVKKSENREKNESLERELRPSNTPLPIDEMELKDKSQKGMKNKRKKEQDMKMRKSRRRKERLEKTPSLKTVRPFSENDLMKCECACCVLI